MRPRSAPTTTRSPPSSSSSPEKAERMLELAKQINSRPANTALGRAANDARTVEVDAILRRYDQGLDPESEIKEMQDTIEEMATVKEPYHFHIYSHRHNCHVTVTKPNRDAILSLSCGNLGFRKSQRKHYDAAYQLGAYVIDKLQQQGWHNKIDKMEVSLRGFGAGREAVTKVLLGNEGRLLRDKIVKVSDSTRLKFGGTRSKKPRRLG